MSDSKNYPQLPSIIWCGFREMLISKPSIQITPKIIAVKFDVQETAAKSYIRELKEIGVLDKEYKPTQIALE